jgi:hypothetical protein
MNQDDRIKQGDVMSDNSPLLRLSRCRSVVEVSAGATTKLTCYDEPTTANHAP